MLGAVGGASVWGRSLVGRSVAGAPLGGMSIEGDGGGTWSTDDMLAASRESSWAPSLESKRHM